jgi:molybdopterin converting factor small subunit
VALFMGLPGNPVSSFVTFLLAVAPCCARCRGMPATLPRGAGLRADFDWPRPTAARVPARAAQRRGGLDLFANQSSGVLTSAVWADGLVDNPPARPSRAAMRCASCPLPKSDGRADEGPGALLRLAARSPGQGEAVELPEGQTLGQLRDALIARGGPPCQVLARGRAVRCALNQTMAEEAAAVAAGAEVAFFPRSPAADGKGAPWHRVSIQTQDFDLSAEVAALRAASRRGCGGQLRGHGARPQRWPDGQRDGARALPRHDREAAIEAMIDEALARFDIRAARVVHRVGPLQPGPDRAGGGQLRPTAARPSRPASS